MNNTLIENLPEDLAEKNWDCHTLRGLHHLNEALNMFGCLLVPDVARADQLLILAINSSLGNPCNKAYKTYTTLIIVMVMIHPY